MRIIIVLLILCLQVSCSENKLQEIKSKKPIISDSILIPLDSLTSSEPNKIQLIESDSGDFLVIINKILPSIEFFSLKDFSKVNSIKLYRDGIDKIGILTGFQTYSKDSIYITSVPPSISMFNFSGEKQKEYAIHGEDQYVQSLNSNNKSPLLFYNGLIYGAYPFITRFWETKSDHVSKIRQVFSLNPKTGDLKWLPVSPPLDLWENGKVSTGFQWAMRGDSIVMAYEENPIIRIFSIAKNEIISTIKIKTNPPLHFRGQYKMPEGNKGVEISLEEGRFELFLYDKYRDVFYCFYHAPINPENYDIKLSDLYLNRPKTGLLILDHNFNFIDEYLFDDFEIQNNNSFVGKKGLYVSRNHMFSDNFDENHLRYDILKFDGLNYEVD